MDKNLNNITEGMFSTIDQIRQDSKDVRDFVKNVFADREFKKMSKDKEFIKYLKSIYEGTMIDEESVYISTRNTNGTITTHIKEEIESVNEGKKRYYQKDGIGKSKYTISYHDGKKKHKDGSDFFDIQIFRNKKDLAKFVNSLHKGGYVYGFGESVNEGKYYITRNQGRGRGKSLVGGYDLKKKKNLPPKEFRTFKDAEKEVKRLQNTQKGIAGGGSAYFVTDKKMNPLKESINEILVIVDKFDKRKQDYGKVYYQDGGKRPGDGDINKAKKELAKLSKKHKGLTLISVGRNSKMYDVMDESVNEVSDSEIKKSIKKKERGGPYTIIARNGNRIVAHSPKSYDKVQDAIKMYHKLNKKHGRRSSVSIEDGYGRTVFMESINEASREAMGIAGFTGTRGSAVQKFIDDYNLNSRKLFNFVKKGKLKDRMDFVTAIAGKRGNKFQGKIVGMFGEGKDDGVPQGYNPMVESKTKESKVVQMIYKYEKKEKKFYDKMAEHERRIGPREYGKFIINALRGFGINPREFKRVPDAEEKLYQTVSKK